MNVDSIVLQLVEISKQPPIWWGESDATLREHFEQEILHGEIAILQKDGEVVAFCDWSWIEKEDDIHNQRWRDSGPVLFLTNVYVKDRSYFWKLKSCLPKFRYICWRVRGDYLKIHAPSGWPSPVSTAQEELIHVIK